MKLTCEMIVASVGDEYVAVPMTEGDNAFRGIVRLNETGVLIMNGLIQGKEIDEIADEILSEYENVTRETAVDAVQSVIGKLNSAGLIEE